MELSGQPQAPAALHLVKNKWELIIYISYCFISINNGLLLVKCYSHLVVSGFSKINLIHVPYLNSVVVLFVSILMLILMGISSLFYVYN